jgi:acyl-CoA thioester hydrolase
MGEWVETYRGMVKAWEVDPVDHFTVAYYYILVGDATLNFFAESDLGPKFMRSDRHALASIFSFARFQAELRKGDVMHIRTGITDVDDRGATVVHQLFNSATNEMATQFQLKLRYMDLDARRGAAFPPAAQAKLERFRIPWEGSPPPPLVALAAESTFVDTAYDTVKPWEIDVLGHLSVAFYIHRFSDASMQMLARVGMTPAYMREQGMGFSTFELQVKFLRELKAGDRVRTHSTLTHVGNSSLRILSRMYNVETGDLAAEISQSGVQLNMQTRRPTRIPSALQEQARALLGSP